MADPLSAWSLPSAFGDVAGAIASGTFDPQGSNFTDFRGSVSMPSSLGAGSAEALGPDVISSEKSKTVSVGTDSYTQTEEKQNRINTPLISQWLVRGVVILLGFIFVAVGLAMFGTGKSATVVIKEAVK